MSTYTGISEHVFRFPTPCSYMMMGQEQPDPRPTRPRGAHLPDDQLRVPRFPACCRPLRSGRRRQHLRTPDQLPPRRCWRSASRRSRAVLPRSPWPRALRLITLTIRPLPRAGAHVVAQKTIYGGTY